MLIKFIMNVAEKIIEKGHSISHIATSYDYEDLSDRGPVLNILHF